MTLKSSKDKNTGGDMPYDFMKDARQIMKGNFPRMRRMKRRLRLEILVMGCLIVGLGWLHFSLPQRTSWITVALVPMAAAFLALQVSAFHAYWYTPADLDHATAMRKIADRTGGVANLMIILNISFAIFNILLFCANTMVTILTWQLTVLILVMQLSIGVFSARWIAYARLSKRQASWAAFENDGRHG